MEPNNTDETQDQPDNSTDTADKAALASLNKSASVLQMQEKDNGMENPYNWQNFSVKY